MLEPNEPTEPTLLCKELEPGERRLGEKEEADPASGMSGRIKGGEKIGVRGRVRGEKIGESGGTGGGRRLLTGRGGVPSGGRSNAANDRM